MNIVGKGFIAALILLVASAWAFGDTLVEGTEVLVSNPSGSVIWGYGVVQGGALKLNMSNHVGDFLLIVMATTGEVRAWPGRMVGGKIEIEIEGGERVGLEGLLEALSLGLSLEQAGPADDVAGESGALRQEAGSSAGELRLERTSTENGENAEGD